MFQRGSKFYSKISFGGPYFSKNLFRGGTNLGGSIFAVTDPLAIQDGKATHPWDKARRIY